VFINGFIVAKDGQINGNERYYLFEDLMLAGIINGNYDGSSGSQPNNAFGGALYILWQTRNGTQDNWVTLTNIPYDMAEMVDRKYDDGVATTGSIRADRAYTDTRAKTIYWRM